MSKYTTIQPRRAKPFLDRFWEKVDRRSPEECWQWLGSRLKPSGHGRFNIGGRVHLAHRVAYEIQNGQIPHGMVVRHRCNFAPCCNPSHLELGTQADNVRDIHNNKEPVKVSIHPLPRARPWAKFNGMEVTAEERFWDKVDKSGECWLWTGAKYSNGYGHFVIGGQGFLAHRLAWEWEHGPIQDGLVLMHTCDVPGCVRGSHLKPGTRAENSTDMVNKGRHHPTYGKDNPHFGKLHTHCNKGHELTDDNIVLTNHGKSRRCRICYLASSIARAQRYIAQHRADVNEKRRQKRAEKRNHRFAVPPSL
jgi:hypothetical protein